MEDYLTRGEKEYLLKVARASLEKFVTEREIYEPQTVNAKLWEKRGVFVTLTNKGDLRGCVGCIEPVESLIVGIRDNIIVAARDSRFEPIERGELQDINIEISILSELEKTMFDEIEVGDGVIIKEGANSATYLPQVWSDFAKEASPKEEFFMSLSQKAGLDRNAYLDKGMEFYKYSVVRFSEDNIG